MAVVRRAVVDIGTNSVKLLVAEVDGFAIHPVRELSEQTRLGRGFYENHRLQPGAILHTADAVEVFAGVARELGVARPRVVATSAVRDAVNAEDLLSAVRTQTDLEIEIISGDQEAAWAYRGVRSDPVLAGRRLLIMDLGGGSTEFIAGDDDAVQFSRSFPLGSVRLLEMLSPPEPPLDRLPRCRQIVGEFLCDHVKPALGLVLAAGRPVQLVGTGGTFTILARLEKRLTTFERDELERTELTRTTVSAWVDKLWCLTLPERQLLPGLPKKRADVILTGAVICEGVMTEFGLDRLLVSTRGIRFGALMGNQESTVRGQ